MIEFVPSPQQAAVLGAPNESMRISAGAGTGKTTTLARRVVALVANGDVEPEQVLGITFTTKAAEELADRIRKALPVAVDREVEVHTYHGFAAHLLSEFGVLVGVERFHKVITPTFARQIITDVVRRIPFPTLDVASPALVDQILGFGAGLADQLVVAGELTPPTPLAPDDPWLKRADFLAAVNAYTAEKTRLGVVDYGDLILLAHRLVSRYPEIATAVAERYRVVMLDEYQDTNPAQRELLRAIFAGRVPVTAVGDADQTIYEWRGASLENFAGFPEHFAHSPGQPAPTLPLSENRRSGPEILALANAVRSRVVGAEFRPPLSPLPDAPPARVFSAWLASAVDEAEWIADRLFELHGDGRNWREMAVLFRKNKDIHLVHDALSRRGIPFEVANLGGLLSVPEVADLHCWLRILDRPEDGSALVRLLTGARYRLGVGDLARLAGWVRAQGRDSEADLDHERLASFGLTEAIDHLEDIAGLRPEAGEALEQFHGEFRSLLELAQGLSLVELCRTVLDLTRAWADIDAMDAASRLSARLNLYRFLDLAADWSPLEGRSSLTAFLGYLAAMEGNPAEELDTARLSTADAVTLITIHRAKGLEWPVVFAPAMYRKNFPTQAAVYDDPFSMPYKVPYELRLDRASLPPITAEMRSEDRKALLRVRHEAQEWRIAYVAVTRAQHEFYASGAWWYGRPVPTVEPSSPSPLFELVDQHATRLADSPRPERPDLVRYRSETAPAPDPLFEGGWAEAVRRTLVDSTWPAGEAERLGIRAAYDRAVKELQDRLFALPAPAPPAEESGTTTSVTGLVTYAICPRRFYWSAVDRLPRRSSAAARRGVDIHRKIELHHRGVVPLEEVTTDLYDAVDTDTGEGGGKRDDPYQVFQRSRFASNRPHLVEVPFQLRLDQQFWVRGRIDALYADGGRWEVVDFKTGLARPEDHATLVQLQAYAVAVHEAPFPGGPPEEVTVTFAHLSDPPIERSYPVTRDWLAAARARLAALAEGITNSRFPPTPSAACHSCDFLRFCPEGRVEVGSQ